MIKESYILITIKERQKMSPNIKGAVLLLLKNPHQLYVCTHPIYKIPSFDHSNLNYTHSLLNNYYLLILGQGYIIFITSEFRCTLTFRLLIRHRSFNLYSHQLASNDIIDGKLGKYRYCFFHWCNYPFCFICLMLQLYTGYR